MKSLWLFLLGISLSACRQETSSPASDVQPEKPATNQSQESEEKVNPDLIIVAADDSIKEVDITVLRAAKLYEVYSGKRVIMTQEIAKTKISFVMKGPLTNAEAARFLQLTLLAEGIAMMPIPDEDDIVRLVPSGPITDISNWRNQFYTDESQLSDEDQLAMFQMSFEYIKPEEGLAVFQAEIGQLAKSGSIAAVPSSSTLIIADSSSLIRKMIQIQKRIDLPFRRNSRKSRHLWFLPARKADWTFVIFA